MDPTLLFLLIGGTFTLVIVAVISSIKVASRGRAAQAEKEIQDYLAGLEQERKRSEIQQGVQQPFLQLNISEQDEYNGFPALIRAVKHHLDYEEWGFRIIHSGKLLNHSGIILQSEYCKLKVKTLRDRPYEEPEISINYGRLHAPSDQHLMTWNGENCYCWHEVQRVLEFLDGMSPEEAINRKFRQPAFIQKFYEVRKTKWSHAEYMLRMHSAIWKHYGLELFKIFDLHYPDRWQQYTDFLARYYELWPGFVANPPMYKVC